MDQLTMALGLARQGNTVMWVEPCFTDSFGAAQDRAGKDFDQQIKVVKANGREEIRFSSGGRLVFRSPKRSDFRGMSADALFVAPSVWSEHRWEMLHLVSHHPRPMVWSLMERLM